MTIIRCPKTASITAVHRDIRETALTFQKEMLLLESELPDHVSFETGPVSPEIVRIMEKKRLSQMYSRVVQVFALLAVEAFLNEYGYLRFAPKIFERKYGRLSLTKKLTNMLGAIRVDFDENSELVGLVKGLAERRNRLVHPRPELEVWGEDRTRSHTTKRLAAVDAKSASAAIQEMERFFQAFSKMDPEAAAILGHF